MIQKTFDLIKRHKLHVALLLVLFFVGVGCDCLFSQEPMPIGANMPPPEMPPPTQQPSMVQQLAAITILSLLPYAIMLLTSYIKIVIVLSLLRNALGVQQSPPNQIITGIALFMSVYVMFPTCLAMYQAAEEVISKQPPQELFSAQSAGYIIEMVTVTKEPLKKFLIRNTSNKHISGFYQLAYRSFPDPYKKSLQPTDFIVVIPSFITTQLKAAFEVGVLIYLPFFVIDLVTANILLAMGMMMLSPLTIALPLKLLLIVMVDGWTLIIQGLVLSFK
ncbi:MAG: type III secretion system export apparatus subunit SctR [Verrucomicrobia bacterium]|nr:type III secretion system export apparatus subunit SctR [Verrucomicrobiota bacterium]